MNKNRKFDYILFNPPYLPTTKSDKIKGKLNLALDGGKDGRKVLDRFLKEFDRYLKPGGKIYLVHSSLSNWEKTKMILKKKGFGAKILEEQAFFFEKIYLLRIVKKKQS